MANPDQQPSAQTSPSGPVSQPASSTHHTHIRPFIGTPESESSAFGTCGVHPSVYALTPGLHTPLVPANAGNMQLVSRVNGSPAYTHSGGTGITSLGQRSTCLPSHIRSSKHSPTSFTYPSRRTPSLTLPSSSPIHYSSPYSSDPLSFPLTSFEDEYFEAELLPASSTPDLSSDSPTLIGSDHSTSAHGSSSDSGHQTNSESEFESESSSSSYGDNDDGPNTLDMVARPDSHGLIHTNDGFAEHLHDLLLGFIQDRERARECAEDLLCSPACPDDYSSPSMRSSDGSDDELSSNYGKHNGYNDFLACDTSKDFVYHRFSRPRSDYAASPQVPPIWPARKNANNSSPPEARLTSWATFNPVSHPELESTDRSVTLSGSLTRSNSSLSLSQDSSYSSYSDRSTTPHVITPAQGHPAHDQSTKLNDSNSDSYDSDPESLDTPVFTTPHAASRKRHRTTYDYDTAELRPTKRSSANHSSTDSHILTRNNTETPVPQRRANATASWVETTSRIIKRHCSLLDGDETHESPLTSHHSQENYAPPIGLTLPPKKKNKINSRSSSHATIKHFATEPASLRRALSLRSTAIESAENENVRLSICPYNLRKSPIIEPRTSISPRSQNQTPTASIPLLFTFAPVQTRHTYEAAPTAPATPVIERRSVPGPRPLARYQRHSPPPAIPFPVPLIAPPPDLIPRLPLSEEAQAKLRLARLLEREGRVRRRDGLVDHEGRGVPGVEDGDPVDSDEGGDRSDEESDGETIGPQSSSVAGSRPPNQETADVEARRDLRDMWETILGIGKNLRSEIVEWILDVIPILEPSNRSSSSSCNSSLQSSTSHGSQCGGDSWDLMDQLTTSPETRFHAAYMFIRYFFLVMAESKSERDANGTSHTSQDGWELITWDIAVGALALSVKYHRDFLAPLNPVFASEFQALAPHGPSYTDLEASQRDILSAFSYSLSDTPQPILDELWLALPSLRQLLDFKRGWNCARKETWYRLFEAASEPDVLQFPISLLTAAALVEGIIAVLMFQYEFEAEWRGEVIRRRRAGNGEKIRYGRETESKVRVKRLRRAERATEGVVQDIQAVLGISDGQLKSCREWFTSVDET